MSVLASTVLKRHVNDKEWPERLKNFKDKEFQDLSDENPAQTLQKFSNSLAVDKSTVFVRLEIGGKV